MGPRIATMVIWSVLASSATAVEPDVMGPLPQPSVHAPSAPAEAPRVRSEKPRPGGGLVEGGAGTSGPKPRSESLALGAPKTLKDARESEANSAPATGGLGVTRTILALTIVVALVVLCAGVAKKIAQRTGGLASAIGAGGKAPSGLLTVLGRYPVSRGATLVVLKFDRRVLLVCQTRSGGTWRGGGSTSMNTLCEATDAPEVASIVALAHQGDGSSIRARFNAELEEACLETSMPVHPRSARATQATTIAPPRDQSTAGVREVSTPGTPPRAGRGILASLAAAVRPRSQATDEGAVTDLRKRLAGMREASGNRAVEIPTRAPSPTPIPTPAPTPAPRRSSSQTEFIA